MKTEHYTSLIAVLAILIMGTVLALGVLYPKGMFQNGKEVSISASGSASALPQQGAIYIYVNGTGDTAGVATANMSLALAQVNSTLSTYANANSITTQYYSVAKEYNSSLYVAKEGVQIIIRNVNNMTNALQSLSNYKNVYVQNAAASLSGSQATMLSRLALQLALKNATAQAEALTENATLTAVNMTTTNYRVYVPLGLGAVASAGVAPETSSQLFFNGNESITESITVTFRYG